VKIDITKIFVNPKAKNLHDLFAITDEEANRIGVLYRDFCKTAGATINLMEVLPYIFDRFGIKNERDIAMLAVTLIGVFEQNKREDMIEDHQEEMKFLATMLPRKINEILKSQGISASIGTVGLETKGKSDGEDRIITNNNDISSLINYFKKGGDKN
jgi:hypothetical protein